MVALLDKLGDPLATTATLGNQHETSAAHLNHLLRQALVSCAGGACEEAGRLQDRLRVDVAPRLGGQQMGLAVGLSLGDRAGWPDWPLWPCANVTLRHAPLCTRACCVSVPTTGSGECGWDTFALSYHLGAPLNAVFTPAAQAQYNRLGRLLWRLRRAERSLNNAWHVLKVGGGGAAVSWCVSGLLGRLLW